MTPIQEVFLERHWDDASIALQQRDIRKAELEAHGFLRTIENLYTVNGDRVFLLVATLPHAADLRDEFPKSDRSSPSELSPQKRILPTRNPARTSRPRTIPGSIKLCGFMGETIHIAQEDSFPKTEYRRGVN